MKNRTKSLIIYSSLVIAVSMAGCDVAQMRKDMEIAAKVAKQGAMKHNVEVLASEGEHMGRLPDGREVVRYELLPDNGDWRHHFVYVVGSDISDNSLKQEGKTSEVATQVIIGGVTYVPKKL